MALEMMQVDRRDGLGRSKPVIEVVPYEQKPGQTQEELYAGVKGSENYFLEKICVITSVSPSPVL